eukprot:3289383-Pyramimonas_sp.AAC.1
MAGNWNQSLVLGGGLVEAASPRADVGSWRWMVWRWDLEMLAVESELVEVVRRWVEVEGWKWV